MNVQEAQKIVASSEKVREAEEVLRSETRAQGLERQREAAEERRQREVAVTRAAHAWVEETLAGADKLREEHGSLFDRVLGANRIEPPTLRRALDALLYARGELMRDLARLEEQKQVR